MRRNPHPRVSPNGKAYKVKVPPELYGKSGSIQLPQPPMGVALTPWSAMGLFFEKWVELLQWVGAVHSMRVYRADVPLRPYVAEYRVVVLLFGKSYTALHTVPLFEFEDVHADQVLHAVECACVDAKNNLESLALKEWQGVGALN